MTGVITYQENEVVTLLLSLGVLVFVLANRPRLRALPAWGVLLAAFCVTVASRVLTVLEGLFWEDLLNALEHVCYAGGALLMVAWCWLTFGRREARR